jgi:DNA-binding MarR family transcriptional regulator
MKASPQSLIVLRILEANKLMLAEASSAGRQGQTMPMGVLNTFLAAAIWEREDNDGAPLMCEELQRRLGVPASTLSGQLGYLGEWQKGAPGLGLVSLHEYPLNRRTKFVRLTDKGRTLAKRMQSILDGQAEAAQRGEAAT